MIGTYAFVERGEGAWRSRSEREGGRRAGEKEEPKEYTSGPDEYSFTFFFLL